MPVTRMTLAVDSMPYKSYIILIYNPMMMMMMMIYKSVFELIYRGGKRTELCIRHTLGRAATSKAKTIPAQN